MSKHVRRSRNEWGRLVELFEESGESLTAFAVRHGITERTLRWWRWRLGRLEPRPVFIPVEVVAPAPSRSMRIEARFASGVVLAFEDVDAAMLRELVAVLGSPT